MHRIFDIILSLVVLLVLSPILLVLGFVLLQTIGIPIIFRQTRPGLHSKTFTFYKFRTMTQETDTSGVLFSDKDRLTKMGSFLRKSSLDELPSLWNVIKGDMSLVGPRPLLIEYLDLYTLEQVRRHEVKPGITGWAQVNGRNAISWDEKFKLDVWYVDNKSFLLDLKILCLTVWKVLKMEGINDTGHVTMEPFRGNQ